MTHTDNIRDPHAIEGLLPWVETVAKNHGDMYGYIMAAYDNDGSRTAIATRYSNDMDLLRTVIGRLRSIQSEISSAVMDKMEELDMELDSILAPQRKPSTDEMEQ